jgi:hypothetical protein
MIVRIGLLTAFLVSALLLASGQQTSADSPASSTSSRELAGSGTQNFIPLWTDNNGTLGNSVFFQKGSGATAKIGLNLKNPLATLDVNGTTLIRGTLEPITKGVATANTGFSSNPLDLEASSFSSTTATAVMQHFEWQAEPTGNNTATTGATLNLLFGQDNNPPAETGLHLSNTGIFSFAVGQTFPGTGTITGVTAGDYLVGGGSSGNVTISLSTDALDTRYADLFAPLNAFTGTVATTGGMEARSGIYVDSIDCAFCSSAATFIKTSSVASLATLAAVEVLNNTTLGEAGWFGLNSTSNTSSVLKLVLPTGSHSNFLDCNIPDGTQKCHITTAGSFVSGSDFAEALPARGEPALYEPGDVLVMSRDGRGVQKTRERYSSRVVGVYSTRPAVIGAEKGGETRVDASDIPVAITGIVPAKVTTENGAVAVGDLLVTSSRPGFAMRAGRKGLPGTIVGKALEPLSAGSGSVKVLVLLR